MCSATASRTNSSTLYVGSVDSALTSSWTEDQEHLNGWGCSLTWYLSNKRLFRNPSISSNFRSRSRSSFFFKSIILKPKMASIPLARQLSYIRNTTSNGNLEACEIEVPAQGRCLPIAKHGKEPLRAKHA